MPMTDAVNERTDTASIERTQSLTERIGPLLLVSAAVFVVDQVTKALIRGWLDEGERWPSDFELIRLTHVENPGAAFGILQGAGPLLVITASVTIALLVLVIWRGDTYPRSHLYALALILGGAVGNLTDRLARGTVTDFIDPTHYWAFNIADSAIVIGVLAVLVLTLLEPDGDEDDATAASDGGA